MMRLEERDPLSATAQSFFGRVLYRTRRYDDAITHLDKAIELAPQSSAGAYGRLTDVYEAMGRYDDALALVEKETNVEGRRPRGTAKQCVWPALSP
jgi:tetratricopeptide (TPR) repeat protein